MEGYTFEEVREAYDQQVCPGAFKYHRGGEYPYAFEISGFTKYFDTLNRAMDWIFLARGKFDRIRKYQAADNLPEPEKETIDAAEVESVGESGWIKTKDDRTLNPQHYEVNNASPNAECFAALDAEREEVIEGRSSEWVMGAEGFAVNDSNYKALLNPAAPDSDCHKAAEQFIAQFGHRMSLKDVALKLLSWCETKELEAIERWLNERLSA